MKLFTIGFTKTSAAHFFQRLETAGARHIVDVRLNNVSQLSGFAKRDDLRYFADRICGMGYSHMPQLAPTKDILEPYRKGRMSWDDYAAAFLNLMAERQIEKLDDSEIDQGCLLCSEDKPHFCHRRLVAEYLKDHKSNVEVVHL